MSARLQAGNIIPFSFERTITTADVEISEEMFIITKETAEAYRKDATRPEGATQISPSTQAGDNGGPQNKRHTKQGRLLVSRSVSDLKHLSRSRV